MNLTLWHLLLFGMLMMISGWVHAENGCPPGFEPTGAAPSPQDPVACRPISSSDQQQATPPTPPPQWASHWGAIATDGPGGSFGASTDMPTQQSADNAALANCRSKKGSNTCKVELAYVNQCVAMAAGEKSHNSNPGLTANIAEQAAMKFCNKANLHCAVYYAGCSLPVQIQQSLYP